MIRPMFPWGTADVPLLILLPIAAALSAVFSGSETAFFGLRAHERRDFLARQDPISRAAAALLANPRMLLITLLLGNIAVNIIYFVVSSVLLLRIDPTTTGQAEAILLSAVMLAAIILVGEVTPKLVAARHGRLWVRAVAVPLLALHGFLSPIRHPLSRFIIEPLIRLGPTPGRRLSISHDELDSLLELSRDGGVIDGDEYDLLSDVVGLSRQRTRDIMTPRVRLAALPVEADRSQVREQFLTWCAERASAASAGSSAPANPVRAPVFEESLDHVVGVLDLRRFFLDESLTVRLAMEPPTFIPELATLDRLLEHFRGTLSRLALVVDEFGQTTGAVSFDDVMGELYGSSVDLAAARRSIMLVGLGRWRVDGDANIHDFADAFDIDLESPRVSTVAGFISQELERVPAVGDTFTIGSYRLTVRAVRRARAVSVEMELTA